MRPFPWSDAIGFGLGVLRLSSRDFWAMTPRELAYAIAAVRGSQSDPMDRASFENLMNAFPDTRLVGRRFGDRI